MGLFKRKKNKKQEEIKIDLYQENDSVVEENNIENNQSDTNTQLNNKTDEEIIDETIFTFNKILSKNDRIITEYYTIKILSRIGLKNMDFNLQMLSMEKNVNRIKKDCFDLNRIISQLKNGLNYEREGILKLYNDVNDLYAFQNGLINQLNEVNSTSYGHLKISTVSVTINKTHEELEKLYLNICNELKPFNTFEEASEYIYYNSGDFIDKLINTFVMYVKESGNEEYIKQYDRKYFLPSDVVISLDIKEWIELYNRLKFVLRLMNKSNKTTFLSYQELYDTFEAKYAVLMMRADNNR